MANNIFDWDDDVDEKAAEDEGAYPLAQPPDASAHSPEPPTPQPEPWPNNQNYEPAAPPEPQQDYWVGYPGDHLEQPTAEQPGVWSEYKSESAEETARKGGLAWSAGIVFFSSVAFMLFLGWIADWLFGSSPWGLVGGIVLGSVLGFIQFFRISQRIFNPKSSESEMRPLMPRDDERD